MFYAKYSVDVDSLFTLHNTLHYFFAVDSMCVLVRPTSLLFGVLCDECYAYSRLCCQYLFHGQCLLLHDRPADFFIVV